MSHLSSGSYVLVHHRFAGLGTRSHLLASSITSRSICSRFFLECVMIQKLSAHMKLHIRWALSSSRSMRTPILFCSILPPHWPRAGWPFLPQTGSFDASVAETSVENKTALNTFEHGWTFKYRHLEQEGRNQPTLDKKMDKRSKKWHCSKTTSSDQEE